MDAGWSVFAATSPTTAKGHVSGESFRPLTLGLWLALTLAVKHEVGL